MSRPQPLLLLFCAALIALVIPVARSQLCESWESPVLVCQSGRTLRGNLALHEGVFSFSSNSSALFTSLSWRIDGEILESNPIGEPTLADILYLRIADLTPGRCPEMIPVILPGWCETSFCPPNALLWTLTSGNLILSATTEAQSLYSLRISDATTLELLETLLINPSGDLSCNGPQVTQPTLPPPVSPCLAPQPTNPPVSEPEHPTPAVETPESTPIFTNPLLPPTPNLEPVIEPEATPTSVEPINPPASAPTAHPSPLTPTDNGTVGPTTFNSPANTAASPRSNKVGLIVGLAIGIPLLAALLIGAGVLSYVQLVHRDDPVPYAPAVSHNNPLYISQGSTNTNPLYRGPDV